MIISKTPYRVSFFGGGSDFPDWYLENGGLVLSTTINKYIFISCRNLPPFFRHKHRFVYSKIELIKKIKDTKHPIIKHVLDNFYKNKIKDGLEIHYDGDFPARSGIGSSSTFTVGLINALNNYLSLSMSTKELAMKSIILEQKILKEKVGSQDQIAAAWGVSTKSDFLKMEIIQLIQYSLISKKLKVLKNNLF